MILGTKQIWTGAKRIINGNKLLQHGYDRIRQIIIKPNPSPRVFVKRGINRKEFFEILNQRKIEYVLLRWWKDFPVIPPGEDMDILIRDEHRELIDDLLTYNDNGTGMKCDIYTITGSKNGCRRGIPYFQSNLAHTLIETRRLYKGVFVPEAKPYFASLAYHALFHKGERSGLSGFSRSTLDAEHNYADILKFEAHKQDLEIEISATGIYKWLKEHKFAPAQDTLTKLVINRPELNFLQERLYSDIRGGDLLVYVIRERVVQEGFLDDFVNSLNKKFCFEIIDVKILNKDEKAVCEREIRGGKWDKGPYRFSGGAPAAFVIAFDFHPIPLSASHQEKQARMTNDNNITAKYSYREHLKSQHLKNGDFNGLHSADNEQDALFYISLMGEEYLEKITQKTEALRESLKVLRMNGKTKP